MLFLVLAAPSLIGWALRPDAYVQRYGRAALNELPFTAGFVAIALIALAGSPGCPLRGDRLSSGRVGLPISR